MTNHELESGEAGASVEMPVIRPGFIETHLNHDLDPLYAAAEQDAARPTFMSVGWWTVRTSLVGGLQESQRRKSLDIDSFREAAEILADLPLRYPHDTERLGEGLRLTLHNAFIAAAYAPIRFRTSSIVHYVYNAFRHKYVDYADLIPLESDRSSTELYRLQLSSIRSTLQQISNQT